MKQQDVRDLLFEIKVIDVGSKDSVYWKALDTIVRALNRYQPKNGLVVELDANGFTVYVGGDYSVCVFVRSGEYMLLRNSPGVSEARHLVEQTSAADLFDRVVSQLLEIAA